MEWREAEVTVNFVTSQVVGARSQARARITNTDFQGRESIIIQKISIIHLLGR